MLSTLLQKSSQTLSDLLYPKKCIHCQVANSWLCQECFGRIPFIDTTVCNRCGTPTISSDCKQCNTHPLQYIDKIRSAAYFEDNPLRVAIHVLKYRHRKVMADVLAQILADTYHQYNLKASVIVPVPLHNSRVKERGYNQSVLLAKQLGKLLQLPVNVKSLQRVRKTEAQMTLGAEERRENVKGAFTCRDSRLAQHHVLLIDDVCTTGSTLDFCAAALKEIGVVSVWGLTLAKAR